MRHTFFTLALLAALAAPAAAQQSQGGVVIRGGVVIGPTGAAPVIISNLQCSNEMETQFTATWDTNVGADTEACRGAMGGPYGTCTALDPTLVTTHTATFTGLSASTTYFWVANSSGATSPEQSCTTTAAAGVPPFGQSTTTDVVPVNWSNTQPDPAAVSISSVSCVAGTCSVTTGSAHNLQNGEYVTITGTGTDADASPATLTGGTQTTTTASFTASANVTFPNGARVYLNGSGLLQVVGAFVVSNVAGATFDAVVLESASRTFTCGTCEAYYAVQVTVTGASTFTYPKAGATGVAAVGTVTSGRLLPPVQLATYTDPSFTNGAVIQMLLNPSSTPCGSGSYNAVKHSTASPFDAGDSLLMTNANTGGPCIWTYTKDGSDNIVSITFVRQISTASDTAAAKWDRNTPAQVWLRGNGGGGREGDTLYRIADVVTSDAVIEVNDFGDTHGCTEIGIAGPNTAHEGPGTTLGGRVAIVCKVSSAPEIWNLISWNINSAAVDGLYAGSANGTGNIDYWHIVDLPLPTGTLIGAGARWSTGGPQSCTISVTGGVATITCSAGSFTHIVDGQIARSFGCSRNTDNRLYTITSHTSAALTASTAAADGSSTGCEIGTESRGVIFTEISAGTTLSATNNLRWVGQHGMFGRDFSGDAVWVAGANDAICPTSEAAVSFKAQPASWVAGTANYDAAKFCVVNGGFVGGSADVNVAIARGWVITYTSSTGASSVEAFEPSLPANWVTQWTGQPAYGEGEWIATRLDNNGDPLITRRLAHVRRAGNVFGEIPYCAFSLDGVRTTCNTNFRFNNGASAGPAIITINFGVW